MSLRREELHVYGKVEGEREEGQDDQVYESDGDGGRGDSRTERAEIELREANGWTESLRDLLKVFSRDAGVLHDRSCPHLTEFGCDLGLEGTEFRQYVAAVGILISCLDVYDLTCA